VKSQAFAASYFEFQARNAAALSLLIKLTGKLSHVDVPARFRVFQKKGGFETEEIVLPIEFPDGLVGAWVSPFKNSNVFGRWRLLQVRVEGQRLSLLSNAPGDAGGMGLTIHVLYHGRAPK
jgi:hypothetical protein